ncbi:MAG: branched-chain amino acid ABC transporter permease [Anaerolineaceae bacterium]|nr:branched-chain amino acid ABC transporter permease [Anaerolineaceae bacterium]
MTTFFEQNRRYLTILAYIIVLLLAVVWLAPVVSQPKTYRLAQSGLTGIMVGGVYALVALGIVVINKASGVFNFAHGWMMLVGGLVFYSFFTTEAISAPVAAVLAAFTVAMGLSTLASDDVLRSDALAPSIDQNPGAFLVYSLRQFVRKIFLVIFGIFIQAAYVLKTPLRIAGAIGVVIVLTLAMSLGGYELQWLHALVGSICGASLLGLTIERYTIRPLIGQPLFAAVLVTLALGEGVIRGLTQITWGSVELTLPIFADLSSLGLPQTIIFDSKGAFGEAFGGPIVIKIQLLMAFVLALVTFAGFLFFFQRTSIGLAMRATSENQQLAQSVGLRVRVILAVAWAIAALLAATAGVLQGGSTSLSLFMPLVALRAFPAVLLGGLESIGGALIGGLVIGFVEQMSTLLFPGQQTGTELAPYVVLMIVLVIRPEGLFGQKRIERI